MPLADAGPRQDREEYSMRTRRQPAATAVVIDDMTEMAQFLCDLCAAQREACIPQPQGGPQLEAISDDRWLSTMTRRVFQAGLKHELVDNKWPVFEKVFQDIKSRLASNVLPVEVPIGSTVKEVIY